MPQSLTRRRMSGVNTRPRALTECAAPDELLPTQWGTLDYRSWCEREAARQVMLGAQCDIVINGGGRIYLRIAGPVKEASHV